MDTFMDKLAQKFTAQEMIKANSAAEAAELQRMRDQVKQYDECLQEMKLVNADTKSTLVQMEKALAVGVEKFEKTEIDTEAIQSHMKEQLDSKCAEITDFVHKECVKVYRNIQAVQEAESAKVEENIQKEVAKVLAKQRANLGVGVTTLIFSIAACVGVVFELLVIFGIITF